jgi:hypothetical protein
VIFCGKKSRAVSPLVARGVDSGGEAADRCGEKDEQKGDASGKQGELDKLDPSLPSYFRIGLRFQLEP